jgi:hypothetical protein
MISTLVFPLASTVSVRPVYRTGIPEPCEWNCGSQQGVVRVYWQPIHAPVGLVHVCLGCARTAIERALDDTPPDAPVVVELELYPDDGDDEVSAP